MSASVTAASSPPGARTGPAGSPGPWRRRLRTLGLYAILIVGGLIMLLPFFWMVATSLKTRAEVFSAPLLAFPWSNRLSIRNVPFLTWAGVRGGISVALVLSLPESPFKAALLAATYAVVLFTIVLQGSTLGLVAKYTLERPGVRKRD